MPALNHGSLVGVLRSRPSGAPDEWYVPTLLAFAGAHPECDLTHMQLVVRQLTTVDTPSKAEFATSEVLHFAGDLVDVAMHRWFDEH